MSSPTVISSGENIQISSSKNAQYAIEMSASQGGIKISSDKTFSTALNLLATANGGDIVAESVGGKVKIVGGDGSYSSVLLEPKHDGGVLINVPSRGPNSSITMNCVSGIYIHSAVSGSSGGLEIFSHTRESDSFIYHVGQPGKDFRISAFDSSLILESGEDAPDAVRIFTVNGGIDIDGGYLGVDVDTTGMLSLGTMKASGVRIGNNSARTKISSASFNGGSIIDQIYLSDVNSGTFYKVSQINAYTIFLPPSSPGVFYKFLLISAGSNTVNIETYGSENSLFGFVNEVSTVLPINGRCSFSWRCNRTIWNL